ncbi:MAG: glycosyl transferase family 1 [Flavobacteriales bacterium]|nr:glycosyl transferase family 1 [Flavobacteriales bacterium]|tara:strand:- start:50641 stop:51771 length:1131 start_codon:yes stop_codon:yes gene_type:complete
MKIGFDAKRVFFNNTGLGNYSRDSVRVLSQYFPKNKYVLYTTKKNINTKTSFINSRDNIVVQQPQSLFSKNFTKYWRSKGIIKDLISDKIEIYHGLSNELPIGIEKTTIKSVVTIHDLIFIRYPHLFKAIDRIIYYKKFKSSCHRADKIIAVSEQTKNDIIQFFNISSDKIKVVYQGCNKIFQKKINDKTKQLTTKKYKLPKDYLLYVGTIEERKNLLTILKTLKELPEYKLVIIGEGKSYKKKCLRFISKYNLSNRVFFLQRLTIKEMAAIYQSANIMIYPSVFEGFGIPIIEALFSRVPVITSKGSCFSEAGGPHSKYIDPLSVFEMKEAIIEIQKSSEKRKFMIENGVQYAKKFTDDKIAKNLTSIYNKIYCL